MKMNILLSVCLFPTVFGSFSSHEEHPNKVEVLNQETRKISETDYYDFSVMEAVEGTPIILPEEVSKTDRTHWYRGDKREPSNIFKEGFTARGNNQNLIEHIHGNEFGPIKDSAYISTSTLEEAAVRYPKDFIGRSYIYLINPEKSGMDVNQALVVEIDAGRMLREDVNYYLVDHEMAVPYKIKKEHIKGAWIADSLALTNDLDSIDSLYSREIHRDSFVSNPYYKKPLSKTVASIRIVGSGLTALGIYHDTTCLWEAYRSGDEKRFFSETSRVIGGWTGAIALGKNWGKQGSSLALRFTKHPGIILASGVVGAVAGSVLGYTGGELIAQEAYEGPSIWTDLYQTLKKLEPDHTCMIESTSQPTQSIEIDFFAKLDSFWTSFVKELREEGSIGAVIKKHLPETSPNKSDLIEFLKRIDYRNGHDHSDVSISSQRTAEEMFGSIQEDIPRPYSELLKHGKVSDDDDNPGKIFKQAKIDNGVKKEEAISDNRHQKHQVLEKAYREAYELTDRVKNIRSSLMAVKNANELVPVRYYADDLRESAGIANSWALTMNSLGDREKGRILGSISSALGQASTGAALLSIQGGSILQTLGGYSSWISAGAVFLSLFMSDDNDENEGLQMLMVAIAQLGQALQHVLRNQEQMMDLMQITLKSIHDIDSRLRQLHAESQEAVDFIASLELQNACLALRYDLNQSNAVSLTKEDRRKALSTLERWLKQHLVSPVITKSSSAPTTAPLAVEFLSKAMHQHHGGLNSMGFIMTQLRNHLGDSLVPYKFTQLPPLLLFMGVSHLFLEAMLKAEVESDDACSSLLNRLQEVIDTYIELAEFIQHANDIWSSLFAQYEHQRNMVGRALAAANIPNQAVPLDSLLAREVNVKHRNLIDALDEMEEKRILLVLLAEFAFDSNVSDLEKTTLYRKIQALESKQQILSTSVSMFYQHRGCENYYLNYRDSTNNDSSMQLALRSGVDLNLPYGGGNVLNYIGYQMINTLNTRPRCKQWEVDRIHSVLKHSSSIDKLNAIMQSTYVPAITWPGYNYAMTMCSNLSRYGFALLLIISGYSLPWDYSTLLNSGWWAETQFFAREYQMFISSTIRSDGVLNRFKLTRAFEYYRACENGQMRKADAMIKDGVDADCVLWLVSLLGKWYIFERLQAPVNLSQHLGKFNFGLAELRGYVTAELGSFQFRFSQESKYTPLMVAAEHGRMDVVEGLIKEMQVAGRDIGIASTLSDGKASAATLAFNEKHFEIAKRLADLGAPLAVLLDSQSLLSGPLTLTCSNPVSELLAASQSGKIIESLQNLSASIKGFSEAFKWVLNSKIRRLMSAIHRQAVLKQQLAQFDNITERISILSMHVNLSGRLIDRFKAEQLQLHILYDKLQAKMKRIANVYNEPYNYENSEQKTISIINDRPADDIMDESTLKDEFMTQISQLSQDFGIRIDKVFELIQEAAAHHQKQTDFNDIGILLIGATGTGKSTILNFMKGCLYKKIRKAGKVMRELISGSEISETSHSARAQTRFPVIFNHLESFSLVDLPGLLDNNENTSVGSISSYDIAAALNMNLISKKFKAISGLIAFCTQAQLTAERPPLELQETFRHIGRIIKDNPELSDNVKLFVTKHSDLELTEVIEGLQQLAIDFNSDENMCTFLNIFVSNEDEAANRIIFTDVVYDTERQIYLSLFEGLKPQETWKFNFSSHSTAFSRLEEFVERVEKLRDSLVEEIIKLEIEKETILDDFDVNASLNEHVPNVKIDIKDDESMDSLSYEQTLFSEAFSEMTILLDVVQNLELKNLRLGEIIRLLQRFKAQVEIKNHFIKNCSDLGLCASA